MKGENGYGVCQSDNHCDLWYPSARCGIRAVVHGCDLLLALAHLQTTAVGRSSCLVLVSGRGRQALRSYSNVCDNLSGSVQCWLSKVDEVNLLLAVSVQRCIDSRSGCEHSAIHALSRLIR